MGIADTGPHADIAIDHAQRRIGTQGIASDITGSKDF
jgi:hypothetical protein